MTKTINNSSIVLAGSGGGGKSTLMGELSNKYNLPIARIETKSMMPQGISSHLDIIKMSTQSPAEGVEFQSKLIRSRSELFCNLSGGFVSDRSVVDSYVYYAIHNSMFANQDLDRELYDLTVKSVLATDLTVVLLPDMSISGIEDNNVRITSIPYFKAVSSIISTTLFDIIIKDEILEDYSFLGDDVSCSVFVSENTALCILNEEQCKNGISFSDTRVKCIEEAFNFIQKVRDTQRIKCEVIKNDFNTVEKT